MSAQGRLLHRDDRPRHLAPARLRLRLRSQEASLPFDTADELADISEDGWRAVQEERAAIDADAAEVLQAGGAADATEAMAVAERHRQAIGAYGPGLTAFLAAAVRAKARRDRG